MRYCFSGGLFVLCDNEIVIHYPYQIVWLQFTDGVADPLAEM